MPYQVAHDEVLYISSSTGHAVSVRGALARSWRSLGGGYGTDGTDVYHAGIMLDGRPDPGTFRVQGDGVATDHADTWINGRLDRVRREDYRQQVSVSPLDIQGPWDSSSGSAFVILGDEVLTRGGVADGHVCGELRPCFRSSRETVRYNYNEGGSVFSSMELVADPIQSGSTRIVWLDPEVDYSDSEFDNVCV